MSTAGDVAIACRGTNGDAWSARAIFIAGRVIPYLSSIWAPAVRRTLDRTSKTKEARICLLRSPARQPIARYQILLKKGLATAGPARVYPWIVEELIRVMLYIQCVNRRGLVSVSFGGTD